MSQSACSRFRRRIAFALFPTACWSCSALNPGASDGNDQGEGEEATASGGRIASASGGTTGGDDDIIIDSDPGLGGSAPVQEAAEIIATLPDGFTVADAEHPETSKGGFHVLGPLADIPAPEGECANILRVIVRDFEAAHDDFENAADWNKYDVLDPLGEARKPEKLGDGGPLHFDEWYQNLEGKNLPFAVDLWLEPVGETFVYDSTAFFPLAGVGFMDTYLFTTELHTSFEYHGGEIFTFRGDDDVFVFINGRLAVNLSGVHSAQEASVNLDEMAAAFSIEAGNVYTFDLFQAERQPGGSNFRVETSLDFTGCGIVLPSDVVR